MGWLEYHTERILVYEVVKMNRAEYRRQAKQQQKQNNRFYVTQAQLTQMAKQTAYEMFVKGMLEFRDKEKDLLIDDVRKVLNLYQAIWRDVLGDMGLLTRENIEEVQSRVNALWKQLDDLVMNNDQYALRKWCSDIGADPDAFGILERQNTPEQIADIFLDMEVEE